MNTSVPARPRWRLNGIHLALVVNVAVTVTIVTLVWTGLRPRTQDRVCGAGEPDTYETSDGLLAA